jgi:hypothetical protein
MTIRRTAGRRTAGSEWLALAVWGNRVAALVTERGQRLFARPRPLGKLNTLVAADASGLLIKARHEKGVEPGAVFT